MQVTVPVLTAAGVDDDLVELDGRCPIDPDSARELMRDAPGWDRVLTHPITGAVLAVDRYTPNADLKRTKQATDRRCRCPGCRMPAHRCDLDHNHAAAEGGATEDCNLSHFCRRHHVLKHQPGWKVRQLAGGRIEWTTPTGGVYVDEPPPRAAYVPDPPPERRTGADIAVVDRGRPEGPRASIMAHHRASPGPRGRDADGSRGAVVPTRRVVFRPDGDSPPF
ncbi:hypothetical protein ACFXP7_12345 [Microbacterium sp. P06]|uniref:hypothetical protein n=1 Tax=Microbacterium sp. P06 TaxID=3366949 RepID=UPI003746F4EF